MLLFCDGFDTTDDGYGVNKWNVNTGRYSSGFGRTGGWGFCAYSTGYAQYTFSTPLSTLVFGCAAHVSSYQNVSWVAMYNGTASQVYVVNGVDGTIKVTAGGVTYETAPGVVNFGTWNYVELKVTISPTVGAIELRVNGATVLTETGIDTHVSGDENITYIRFKGIQSNVYNVYLDDLYICDTTGTENNDFLGDITVTPLLPVSDGTHGDFTPLSGGDNYADVDDNPLASSATYISSDAVGAKDSFNMTTYTDVGDILGVQVTASAKNTTTGTINVRALLRSGTTPADSEGADLALSQSILGARAIWEKEPTDDVAWTVAKVNASEFGIKIES